jgi:hypothetical protein
LRSERASPTKDELRQPVDAVIDHPASIPVTARSLISPEHGGAAVVAEERPWRCWSGIVPVELLLGRTDTDAVLVTGLRAYPTGLEFALTGRPRPDQLQQRRHDPDRPHRFAYRDLWLELRFADGQTASNHPRHWPHTYETHQPDPPFLDYHGAGGSERGWRSRHWLWGLPPRSGSGAGPCPFNR